MKLVNESFNQFVGEGYAFGSSLADYEVERTSIIMYVDTEEWNSARAAYKFAEDWVAGKNSQMQSEVESDLETQDISFNSVEPIKIDYKNSNDYTVKIIAKIK